MTSVIIPFPSPTLGLRLYGAHCETVNWNKCSDWNRSDDLRH